MKQPTIMFFTCGIFLPKYTESNQASEYPLIENQRDGGMCQKYTLPYVKYIASGNLLYDSGNSNWGSVIT